MKLMLNNVAYEVRKPVGDELDLARLRSVVGSLMSVAGQLDGFTTALAKAKPEDIEALIDANFDAEIAAERLEADVARRVLRFAKAAGNPEFLVGIEKLAPETRTEALVGVSAQIFDQCVGSADLLKNSHGPF